MKNLGYNVPEKISKIHKIHKFAGSTPALRFMMSGNDKSLVGITF